MRDAPPDGYDAANLEAMGEAVAYQAAMRQLVIEKLDLRAAPRRVLDFGAGRGDYAVGIQASSGQPVECWSRTPACTTAIRPAYR
jgi:ubiquinone/menaquinone biosynthesis C-methylase UbiE